MKVTIYGVVKVGDAEIPDKCPNCNADLTKNEAIGGFGWKNDGRSCYGMLSKVEGGLNMAGIQHTANCCHPRPIQPTTLECARCLHVLASAETLKAA